MSKLHTIYREPFSLGQPQIRAIPPGSSLVEIAKKVDGLPFDFFDSGRILVNGEVVPRAYWDRVRPKADTVVTLHAAIAGGGDGGGGGKQVFALIAAIALTVVTGGIAAGSLAPFLGTSFAAGTLGASLLAGAISIGGALAIGALTSPPVVKPEESGAGSGGNRLEPASVSGNVLEPNTPVPRVIGTRRVHPPFLCEPIIELVGQDEFVEAVYGLAGPHSTSDYRLGDGSVEIDPVAQKDVELEARDGLPDDLALTLTVRQGRTIETQVELSTHQVDPENPDTLIDDDPLPVFHAVTTRTAPDENWLHFNLAGLTQQDDPDLALRIPIRIRMRRRGDTTWRDLPEIHYQNATQSSIRFQVKFYWGDPWIESLVSPPASIGFVTAFKVVPAQDVAVIGEVFTADSYFSAGSGNDVYEAGTQGTTNIRNMLLYSDRVEFYLDEDEWEPGVYDIEVKRGAVIQNSLFDTSNYEYNGDILDLFGRTEAGTLPFSRAGVLDTLVMVRLVNIWNEYPVTQSNMALIALKAKNRSVRRLSCLASGLVLDQPLGQGPLFEKQDGDARYAWSWDEVGTPTDVEVLTLIRPIAASAQSLFVSVRGSGAPGSDNLYSFGFRSSGSGAKDTLAIQKNVSATLSVIDSVHFPWSLDRNYWFRFRAINDEDTYTKSLLHFDGVDGSTTFTDKTGKVWTASGNAQIDTAQSKFGGASGLFDGTGDFISTPNHADFEFNGDFTIDAWFNCNVATGAARAIAGQSDGAATTSVSPFILRREPTGEMRFRLSDGSAFTQIIGTTLFSDSVNTGWHHIAVTRSGNTLRMFIDGVQEGGDVAFSGTVPSTTEAFVVGARTGSGSDSWNGWIDEFSFRVGVAARIANFTPPTSAYAPTVTLKGKAWSASLPEPTEWNIELEDSDLIGSGRVGFFGFYEEEKHHCNWFSVGLNGNAAPSPPSLTSAMATDFSTESVLSGQDLDGWTSWLNANTTAEIVESANLPYNGNQTEWTELRATSNPAPHFRDILTGVLNYDPLPAELFDEAGVSLWRQRCAAADFTCDMVVEGLDIADLLRVVSSCGYARLYRSEIWGVIQDQSRVNDSPVQIFSPRNSTGFSWQKAFPRLPAGFRVNFREEDNEYDTDQIIIYRNNTDGSGQRLEQLTYDGLVRKNDVIRRATFDLRQAEARSTFYSFTAPAESIVCRRGSLIGVNHDILTRHSGYARVSDVFIDEGLVTGVRLDSLVEIKNEPDVLNTADVLQVDDILQIGIQTAVGIRSDDGMVAVRALLNSTEETDELEFENPLPLSSAREGNLAVVGLRGSEYKRLVVSEIVPNRDFEASFICVDEASEIFDVFGEI